MSRLAIEVENVTKRFRAYRSVVGHTSLKTAVVSWLRSWGTPYNRLTDPNRFDVLRDVSFSVAAGETLGLIGRNGAGKSTLLKMIAGIYRPDAGRLAVNGRLAALVELGAGFHPEFTGRENILINGIILGLSKREVYDRFGAIVDFAEIGDFLDAPVRTYSSGMFMRLAFSLAVHVDPDILLIDEILAVGDEAFQRKCEAMIETKIRSRRQATVIVSHDLDKLVKLCDRCLLLDPPHARMFEKPAEAVEAFRKIQREKMGPAAAGAAPAPEPIEIDDVAITAGERPVERVEGNSRVSVSYRLRFLRDVARPLIGMSIERSDRAAIFASNSERLGQTVPPQRAGDALRVRWSLDLRLAPGVYTLNAAVADGDERNVVFWPPRRPRLEVIGESVAIPGADLSPAIECRPEASSG